MLKKDSKFIENENALNRLYDLKERSNAENYQIIVLAVMNLTFLEEYPLVNCDEDTQLELINLRSDYYFTVFKALRALKNPTENDVLDLLKYRAIAYEYHPEEVDKIELEFKQNDDKLKLDHDFSLALYLNELGKNDEPQLKELEQNENQFTALEQEQPIEKLEQHVDLKEQEAITQNLEELDLAEDFHLIENYEPKDKSTPPNKKLMREEVKNQYHDSLFTWAKNLRPELLERYINRIIDVKYTPLLPLLSFRQRTIPVKEYLNSSKQERGDNRLAYILSSGTQDDGALNTLLVEGLTPLMLRHYPIPSIARAIRDKKFEQAITEVTRDVVSFAKKDMRFTHLYSDTALSLVYKAIYDWVDTLTVSSFQSLIKSALRAAQINELSKNSNIEECFKSNSNSSVLAMIFIKEVSKSNLSTQLFDKIVKAIKKEMVSEKIVFLDMQQDSKYQLVANFNLEEHTNLYLETIRAHHETIAAAAKQQENVILNNVY